VFVSCAAAVAAKLLGKPVKIFLDRDVDMATTGQRHAFVAKYKASANRETGKLTGLSVKLYANMGSSFDLTGPVMDRALFHVDNAYKVPNVSAHGFLCYTNLPSNTAFRGFGGPQGLQLCETYMTHLADVLGMLPRKLREINMYNEGELTHFDQPVLNNPLHRMFAQITESADVEKREAEIVEFNKNNRYVKKGIDVIPVKFGISFTAKFMNQGGALVHVYTDGTILVNHGGMDIARCVVLCCAD
jgi:xanthine dehydrogenase/oxidase